MVLAKLEEKADALDNLPTGPDLLPGTPQEAEAEVVSDADAGLEKTLSVSTTLLLGIVGGDILNSNLCLSLSPTDAIPGAADL